VTDRKFAVDKCRRINGLLVPGREEAGFATRC